MRTSTIPDRMRAQLVRRLEGTTPWDVGTMQPPLQDVMPRTDIGFEKKGHALVPGCGRGYDAVFLASLGYNTTGVDISPIAVSKANESAISLKMSEYSSYILCTCRWLEALPDKPANVRFELQNFFEFQPPAGGFDLIYDYTLVSFIFIYSYKHGSDIVSSYLGFSSLSRPVFAPTGLQPWRV